MYEIMAVSYTHLDVYKRQIYNFKQVKRDYRAKTLKLDVEVQKGFEKIVEDLKDSGVTQQELLNYILNQYIKFYENIK